MKIMYNISIKKNFLFRNVSNSQTRNTLLHKDKGKRKRINPELPLPKKARIQKGKILE